MSKTKIIQKPSKGFLKCTASVYIILTMRPKVNNCGMFLNMFVGLQGADHSPLSHIDTAGVFLVWKLYSSRNIGHARAWCLWCVFRGEWVFSMEYLIHKHHKLWIVILTWMYKCVAQICSQWNVFFCPVCKDI